MAELTHHLKVNIDPEAMNDIKRALHKDTAEVAEQAFKEGFVEAYPEAVDPEQMQQAWEESETKQKLDNVFKS